MTKTIEQAAREFMETAPIDCFPKLKVNITKVHIKFANYEKYIDELT